MQRGMQVSHAASSSLSASLNAFCCFEIISGMQRNYKNNVNDFMYLYLHFLNVDILLHLLYCSLLLSVSIGEHDYAYIYDDYISYICGYY